MLKKQIGAMCVAIIMMCSMIPTVLAIHPTGSGYVVGSDNIEILPAVEGQSNLITNGGLEGTSSIENWTPYGGRWDDKVTVEKERTHSGQSALKLSDNESTKPWAMQFFPVVGGAEYQITCWVWREGKDPLPAIKCEGYNTNIKDGEFAAGDETISPFVEEGRWEQISWKYVPHHNARYIALYLRMRGKGTIIWDDVSIHMVKGPTRFDVELNSLNYYVTETEGYATFSVNQSVYTDFKDWSIGYKILKGEELVSEKKGISLAMGNAEISFDISVCDDKDALYTFEATLFDGNNSAAETKTVDFRRRYERPTKIGEDTLYYDENGEIFHPVMAYHLYKAQYDLGFFEEMGINVAQLGHGHVATIDRALETLDILHEKGVKAMMCLYYGNLIASDPVNVELVKEYIKKTKDHPAVWAWAIQDEPVGKNLDEALIMQAYELVRELDPVHPVYTIDQREWMYPTLIRNADVISIDNYPYGSYDAMEYIYSSTKYAVELAGKSGKPIYPLLQFFPRGSGQYSKTEKYFPTGNAMRNMIYQAFMAGSKGYGFFAFDAEVDGVPVYETETADAIREYNAKEKEMMFEYFVEKKYTTFNSNYEDNPDYRYFSFVKDGAVYMVVLNRHEYEKTKAQIPLLSDNGLVQLGSFKAEAYAGTTDSTSGIKTLSITLEPGAAAVYKITANNKIDEEKLLKKVAVFKDLEGYDWAEAQIEALYKKSIVNAPEEGKFLPGENITRGDFAGFLVRTLGLENEAGEQFGDVPADHLYAKEIAVGRAAGILNGVGDNAYAPEAPITRQDMMTLIARGLSLGGKSDLSVFSDSDKIADYAFDCVSAMIATGLIKGNSDGTLNPLGNTTRAEAAVIMQRILDNK